MLYEVILKTLKNHAFAHVYAHCLPGAVHIFGLVDGVFGLRNVKLS